MKAIMTNHVLDDRMERMLFIAESIGWGEPMVKRFNAERNNIEIITTTGVLLIKTPDDKALITAFVPDMARVTAICRKAGMNRIPASLYNTVQKNQKKIGRRG